MLCAVARPGEALVTDLAARLGLAIDPAWLPAVAEQLAGLLAAGALVAEMPLPDEVEGAPVFEP